MCLLASKLLNYPSMKCFLTAIALIYINKYKGDCLNFSCFQVLSIFNTLYQSWKLFMHSACLSVSNSRKYSSNVLKFMHVIYIWYNSNRIKNGIHETNGSSTEMHKNFQMHYGLWGKTFKAYLTCSYCNKCNEINICHSDVQNHFSYKKYYIFCIQAYTKFSDALCSIGGGILKAYLTYLYSSKYNEINHISFKCTKASFVCKIIHKIFEISWALLGNV